MPWLNLSLVRCGAITLFFVIVVSFAAASGAPETTATQPMDAPVITNCPQFMFSGYICNDITWDFEATPVANCETLTWSVVAVNYQPVGAFAIDENGAFAFTLDAQDGGAQVNFRIVVTDNCGAADSCTVLVNSLNSRPYLFHIGTVSAMFGDEVTIPITKVAGSDDMTSFDFTISYDPAILNFISADLGTAFGPSGCNWEYFTYEVVPEGPNYEIIGPSIVRLTGIADINNGEYQPGCYMLPDGAAMVNLHYTLSHNHYYECAMAPIRFVWNDCSDNTSRSQFGNMLNTSCRVFDYSNANPETESVYELTDTDCGELWHFGGSCGACQATNDRRFATFWNGAVSIPCDDSAHCIRGDMNINMIAYEVGDIVTYINYWFYGLPALDPDPFRREAQICNSDVNGDGVTLTVGDIVYMFRVMGREVPALVPKLQSSSPAGVVFKDGIFSIGSDVEIGGISIDLKSGSATLSDVRNLTDFEMREGSTPAGERRILFLPPFNGPSTRLESGTNMICEITGDAEIADIIVVDYYGNPITVNRESPALPSAFSLSQNTPNPFNPTTRINFGLPIVSDWTLEIINVSGQVVKSFRGRNEGNVSVEWNASDQPSGVYFYKLRSGAFVDTKKMVLLK